MLDDMIIFVFQVTIVREGHTCLSM